MKDILKTWPAFMDRRHVLKVFRHDWGEFYFTLGRGKPQEPIDRLWYTHQGQIIGHFRIHRLVMNDGTNIPKLRSISGEVSDWQIKLGSWVAVCRSPFTALWACANCGRRIEKRTIETPGEPLTMWVHTNSQIEAEVKANEAKIKAGVVDMSVLFGSGFPADCPSYPGMQIRTRAEWTSRNECRVFHIGGRGWRYFDVDEYMKTMESKVHL